VMAHDVATRRPGDNFYEISVRGTAAFSLENSEADCSLLARMLPIDPPEITVLYTKPIYTNGISTSV